MTKIRISTEEIKHFVANPWIVRGNLRRTIGGQSTPIKWSKNIGVSTLKMEKKYRHGNIGQIIAPIIA
jgi:hypothetical protein